MWHLMRSAIAQSTRAGTSKKHGVHPTMISSWSPGAIKNMAAAFDKTAGSVALVSEAEIDKLHSKIGQLVVECDFLKRAFGR